uniref:Mothers against decapentaplegic homolog n=1 Tax=Panagrellus redivivus TaxID=6233 RepID=A0A7E4VBQ6_PANRE
MLSNFLSFLQVPSYRPPFALPIFSTAGQPYSRIMVSASDAASAEYEIRENRFKLGRILKNFDSAQGPIRNVLDHIVNVVRPTTKIDEPYAVKTLKHLIKNTRKRDCLALWEAVCNENPATPCVIFPIPKADITDVGAQMKQMPHVFFMKMLRNPDVLTHHELRPVRHCTRPFMKNAKVTEVCINPWHYTMVATGLVQNKMPCVWLPAERQPFDASRPAFTGYASENFDHDALCSPGGVPNATIEEAPASASDAQSPTTSEAAEPMDTTQLIEVKYNHPDYWCDIIYYELNQRIGHKFSAKASSIIVDGFTSPTDEDRFCLGQLNNINRDKATLEARKNIATKGRGIRLYSINGEVFIESLCENSVFVQSPNTNMRLGYHPATVCKVPRGVSLMIFNMKQFEKMFSEAVERGYEAVYALMRMCVLRISFVKGWGSNYRRSKVTMTPCWIEVYLRGPLEWLDMALTQMGPPHMQCSSNT